MDQQFHYYYYYYDDDDDDYYYYYYHYHPHSQDGDTFKVTLFYRPYFYVGVSDDRYIPEVTQLLQRKFDNVGEWWWWW